MSHSNGAAPEQLGAVVPNGNGMALSVHDAPGLQQLVVAAGDAERERIERDIHDGAQQRFTALRVRLELAAERHQARGEKEVSTELRGFAHEVEDAIDDIR